eukprot:m.25260 g.25260  ORF g.25260 m.25260 type:complete len:433 (+) comp28769_c0_seq2:114-1412(+)
MLRQRTLTMPCRKSDFGVSRKRNCKRSRSALEESKDPSPKVAKKEDKENQTNFGERILCRDAEINAVERFVIENAKKSKSGSLYISGPPGTGKTACVNKVLAGFDKGFVAKAFVNCMRVKTPQAVFGLIATELEGRKIARSKNELLKRIEKRLVKSSQPVVIIVDEVDQLETKDQDVLYTLFGWTTLPGSKAILIAIANSLDLTDRLLPRLQAQSKSRPQLLKFTPYSTDQIVEILQGNLNLSYRAHIDPLAIQFCARKVAAITGDIRKAFDICRRALALQKPNLKPCLSTSPMPHISVAQIADILSNIYDSQALAAFSADQGLPLQQKVTACTLLALVQSRRVKEVSLGRLHEAYRKASKECQVTPVEQGEFVSLCRMLQERGIVALGRCKDVRLGKVHLAVDEGSVDHAVKDRTLLERILNSKILKSCKI